MKAAVCPAYGPPEVLKITELPKPVLRPNEVLIKIMATAVNSGDVRTRGLAVKGVLKLVMRLVLGIRKPRKQVLGVVLSGVVEQVGQDVKNFQPKDEVMGSTGMKFGCNAEYIALHENGLVVPKPKNASFEEAAAIIFGGMSAIYFLKKAGIASKPAQKVLIYGATGSVGVAAVEIARHHKAQVTAVCSAQGVELVKKLGADAIIIYTEQDFTKLDQQFDIVFDAVGKTSKKQCKPLLAKNGKFVTVGGLDVAKETKEQLTQLQQLYENGEIHAHIDRSYTLDDIAEAHCYVDTGKKKGNVVVTIG